VIRGSILDSRIPLLHNSEFLVGYSIFPFVNPANAGILFLSCCLPAVLSIVALAKMEAFCEGGSEAKSPEGKSFSVYE
jgi:hypothetical protein